MIIKHNIPSLNTYRQLSKNQSQLVKSMEKLSSGLKINRAGDDAAGLSISEKMRAQIRGLEQVSRNIQDTISLVQTAEGGLKEIHSLLHRGRELAVQASNGTLTVNDRKAIEQETNQIVKEIDNIAINTKFNGKYLLSSGSTFSGPSTGGGTGGTTNPPPSSVDTITTTEEAGIIDSLKRSMLEQSESMVLTHFGIQADNSDLTIYLDDPDGNNTLAFVSYYVGADGKGVNLELHLDKGVFTAPYYPNGGTGPIYNDRIIVHEMTHAIMARSMNFASLPKWFKEGAAEFIHGGDERLEGDIYYSGKAGVVSAIGDGTDSTWVNDSKHYSAGYTAVRYLHDRIKDAGGEGIKDVMVYLNQHQDQTLDDALRNISKGSYMGGITDFISDYKTNGVDFINTEIDLTNSDTGAIGGFDADSGAIKTAENVVADTDNYNEDPLTYFNEVWPVSLMESTSTTSPFVSISNPLITSDLSAISSNKLISTQIGANSGQTFVFNRSNATTINLSIDDVDMINNPTTAIEKFNVAIGYVSSERSRYGAIQNRLEHAFSNSSIMNDNLVGAESLIRDADIAKEMMQVTKKNILAQVAQSMLSQANQHPQGVLKLLG
ncbi:flagellinolysin [Aquibacillus kalidii]|uniref:flagellinolysin n=1 Tax=Aquibacillus kalidii TaxID=2762597 RepID=UPI0016494F52|nr:flagellinolysin [Aquibacillus kalidii]